MLVSLVLVWSSWCRHRWRCWSGLHGVTGGGGGGEVVRLSAARAGHLVRISSRGARCCPSWCRHRRRCWSSVAGRDGQQLDGISSRERGRRGIYRHGGHRSPGATSRVAAQDLELQQQSVLIQKWGKVIISKLAISVGVSKSANLPTIVKNRQLFFSFYGVRSRVLTFQSVRF